MKTKTHETLPINDREPTVLRESIPNPYYEDEAGLLNEMWERLKTLDVPEDSLLFTGHARGKDDVDQRNQTFAVTTADYTEALSFNHGDTPLPYAGDMVIDDKIPVISVYDARKLRPVDNLPKVYEGTDSSALKDALIAEFDVSEWTSV